MNDSVIAGNLSETLFIENERQVGSNNRIARAFSQAQSVSSLNSLPQMEDNLKEQMPAFLEQAHLSTWYQDNPWGVLTANKAYNLPTMGGELIKNQPPGYRPGNILVTQQSATQQPATSALPRSAGVAVTQAPTSAPAVSVPKPENIVGPIIGGVVGVIVLVAVFAYLTRKGKKMQFPNSTDWGGRY